MINICHYGHSIKNISIVSWRNLLVQHALHRSFTTRGTMSPFHCLGKGSYISTQTSWFSTNQTLETLTTLFSRHTSSKVFPSRPGLVGTSHFSNPPLHSKPNCFEPFQHVSPRWSFFSSRCVDLSGEAVDRMASVTYADAPFQ